MADNVTNELLLENLKAIRGELSLLREDMSEIKADVRGLKTHMSGFMQTDISQDSAIASMNFSMKIRLDRIENRLELAD